MKKKVSLKDIAQKVGVSTALVSYVLNDQKQDRISKEVAKKIKATALSMNYRPNQIARSLKTSKTNTIGLIVADIANPFSSCIARIIEDEAARYNYTVLFGSSDENPEKSQRLIDTLLDRQVDGLIIAAVQDTEQQIKTLTRQKIPFILIDRYFPEIPASYVAIDNYKAAAEATGFLLASGCERIGFITHKTTLFHLEERKRGFLEAFKSKKRSEAKKRIREISGVANLHEVNTAIEELLHLDEPVDALLFASNTLSLQGLKYLNTLKLKVPKDLSVVAFDETDASELFYAPLTHIKQPLLQMGQLATRHLLEMIDGNSKKVHYQLSAPLVAGKSTL